MSSASQQPEATWRGDRAAPAEGPLPSPGALAPAAPEAVRLQGPAPWCDLDWTVLSRPRTRFKARVLVARCADGQRVVCKDFSEVAGRRFDLTWRWRKANERAALAALVGLPGVPQLLASWSTGLVMSWVPGRPLGRLDKDLPDGRVFDRLDALLQAIHARGVSITDLHRLNILIADDGAVHIVDFELALRAGHGPGRLLARWAATMDEHAACRQRRRHGAPLSPRQERLLARPPAGRRTLRLLRRGLRTVATHVLRRDQ